MVKICLAATATPKSCGFLEWRCMCEYLSHHCMSHALARSGQKRLRNQMWALTSREQFGAFASGFCEPRNMKAAWDWGGSVFWAAGLALQDRTKHREMVADAKRIRQASHSDAKAKRGPKPPAGPPPARLLNHVPGPSGPTISIFVCW